MPKSKPMPRPLRRNRAAAKSSTAPAFDVSDPSTWPQNLDPPDEETSRFIRSCYQAEAAAPVSFDRAACMSAAIDSQYDKDMECEALKIMENASSDIDLEEVYTYLLSKCHDEFVESLELAKNETAACGRLPEGEFKTWNSTPRTKEHLYRLQGRMFAILRLQAKLKHVEAASRPVDLNVYRSLASKLQEFAAKYPDQDFWCYCRRSWRRS